MHKRLKNKYGFTITELLIVVVVIGILATLAVVGYQAYIKNAKKAQVATTAISYKGAVASAIGEDKNQFNDGLSLAISCISTNDANQACCYYIHDVQGFGCINNQLQDDRYAVGEASQKGTDLSTSVRSYLKNSTVPLFPANGTPPDTCSNNGTLYSQSYSTNLACRTQQVALHWSSSPQGKTAAYIHYFLPVDLDCPSKDIATLQAGSDPEVPLSPNVTFEGAPYTKRKTTGSVTYTFCMARIK